MIDTIVLMLDTDEFRILEHDKFQPSTKGFFESPYYPLNKGSYKCTQNPTKKDYEKTGKYKPRLTVTKRVLNVGFSIQLRIEFSIPKLLHGNNFVEVSENDFEAVIDALKTRLKEMGVYCAKHILIKASVSLVHYSKNIILEEFMTSSMVINLISKAKMNNRLDLNQTDFRNGGHGIKYHANSYEIAVYDKVKDMQQSKVSEKRAIEEDCYVQIGLFDSLSKKKSLEVIRIETRLNTKAKIKDVLKKNNIQAELVFSEVFNQQISKSVLAYYWEMITKETIIQVDSDKKPEDLFQEILANNQEFDTRKVLQSLGMALLVDSVGRQGFDVLISKKNCARTVQRIKKQFKDLKLGNGVQHFVVSYIAGELESFISIDNVSLFNNEERKNQ